MGLNLGDIEELKSKTAHIVEKSYELVLEIQKSVAISNEIIAQSHKQLATIEIQTMKQILSEFPQSGEKSHNYWSVSRGWANTPV